MNSVAAGFAVLAIVGWLLLSVSGLCNWRFARVMVRYRNAAAQARVSLAELDQWRATARTLAGAPLPFVGLPWSSSDSEGNTIRIRRDDIDPETLIVCTEWTDPGGVVRTCATLGWEARTQAASALLSNAYTPVGEQ